MMSPKYPEAFFDRLLDPQLATYKRYAGTRLLGSHLLLLAISLSIAATYFFLWATPAWSAR